MLLFYLTTVYGISAAVGATIFLVVRWVNVFRIRVGAFVDKHNFKSGKYRPYLIYCGIPMTIFTNALLANRCRTGQCMYAFIAYLAAA